MAYNFELQSVDELKRKLAFHENDCGTMTIEEELRRLHIISELHDELARRVPA